jgi:hypothetical protein
MEYDLLQQHSPCTLYLVCHGLVATHKLATHLGANSFTKQYLIHLGAISFHQMKLQSTCVQARTCHTMCWNFHLHSNIASWKICSEQSTFLLYITHMYDLNHTWKKICQGFAKLQNAHCPIVKSTIATFAFPPCSLHIAILPNCQVLVHLVDFLQWASSCPHIKKICGLLTLQMFFPSGLPKLQTALEFPPPPHGLPSEFTCGVYLRIAKLDWCVLNLPSTNPLLFLKEDVKRNMAHYWRPLCPWMSLIKGMSFLATVISWMNFSPCKFNFSIMEFWL